MNLIRRIGTEAVLVVSRTKFPWESSGTEPMPGRVRDSADKRKRDLLSYVSIGQHDCNNEVDPVDKI